MITKFQNENREINRSEIKLAGYNPRKISDQALKKLKKNIKVRGLMGGLAWNETTGNLISGHQRLSVIDQLMKYTGAAETDYKVRVDVARLSETDEKKQNIFMNGRAAQGEWDMDLLKDLVRDVDISMCGLTDLDLEMLNATAEMHEPIESGGVSDFGDEDPKEAPIKDEEDPFITIHFDDFLAKAEFMEKLGFEIHRTTLGSDEVIDALEDWGK